MLWCDGLALGSPTNMGLLSWKMKRFWDETMAPHWMKVDGKIACAFSSSGGWGGGTELACQFLLTVLLNFGFLVFGVTDYAGKLTTAHYGAITAREPRERANRRRAGCWASAWPMGRCLLRRPQGPTPLAQIRCPSGPWVSGRGPAPDIELPYHTNPPVRCNVPWGNGRHSGRSHCGAVRLAVVAGELGQKPVRGHPHRRDQARKRLC